MQNHIHGVKRPTRQAPDPEEMLAKVRAATEEMTMHRYVHTIPMAARPCPNAQWEQLAALELRMEEQNQILKGLLDAVDRLIVVVGQSTC